MALDDELDGWRAQWRTDDSVPAGLQARVVRETRRLKWTLVAECVVTAIAVGVSSKWLLEGADDARVLATVVWVSTLTAWIFSITNRLGTWRPATNSTAAFLELSLLRLERQRQGLAFSSGLYTVMMSLMLRLVWERAVASGGAPENLWAFMTAPSRLVWWLVTALFFGGLAWKHRQANAESARLRAVRAQIIANGATDQTAG